MQCCKKLLSFSKFQRFRVLKSVRKFSTNKSVLSVFTNSASRGQVPITTTMLVQYPSKYHPPVVSPVSRCSTAAESKSGVVDQAMFERTCEETLESLSEYFEELIESSEHLNAADVAYSSGVLTINFGPAHGTYVINRQSPNRQIWLSSPSSGPKRYDFVTDSNYWIYKHDGQPLHKLLQEEISKIVKNKVDFSKCSYSRAT